VGGRLPQAGGLGGKERDAIVCTTIQLLYGRGGNSSVTSDDKSDKEKRREIDKRKSKFRGHHF